MLLHHKFRINDKSNTVPGAPHRVAMFIDQCYIHYASILFHKKYYAKNILKRFAGYKILINTKMKAKTMMFKQHNQSSSIKNEHGPKY